MSAHFVRSGCISQFCFLCRDSYFPECLSKSSSSGIIRTCLPVLSSTRKYYLGYWKNIEVKRIKPKSTQILVLKGRGRPARLFGVVFCTALVWALMGGRGLVFGVVVFWFYFFGWWCLFGFFSWVMFNTYTDLIHIFSDAASLCWFSQEVIWD